MEFLTSIKIADTFDQDANVVLFNGDCLELLSQIPSDFVKLVVTSPPYNIGKSYEKRLDLDTYLSQQEKVIKECVRILDDKGSLCWEVGNYINKREIVPLDIPIYSICKSLGLKLRNRIVWHFGHGLHASKRFSGRYETIIWFTKSDSYTFNLDNVRIPQKYPQKKYYKGPKKGQVSGNPLGKNPSDVWEIPNVKCNHPEKTIHPCQFPVELIERLVLSLTNPRDWVFDPFIGVGSTAIASVLHKRKAIGTDTVSDYISIAKNRLKLLSRGKLNIRPMGTPIYEPPGKSNQFAKPLFTNLVREKRRKYK